MKTMFLLLLAVLPAACQPAQSSEDCEKEAAKPVVNSCEFHFVANTSRAVFQYTPDVPAPTGATCTSLGGGVYDCPDTFCNVVSYAGNCPECPGGGE